MTPREELEAGLRELTRRVWARQPLTFGREALAAHFPLPPAPMHQEMMTLIMGGCDGTQVDEHLTDRAPRSASGRKIALAAPRNFAKSTLGSLLLPLHQLYTGQRHFIVLISNTYSQAIKFLQAIKHEVETNTVLASYYPWVRRDPEKWAEGDVEFFVGTTKAKMIALGAEAQLRGLKFLQYRPDLIVLDDVEDDELVRSDIRRQHLMWWLDHVVLMTNPHALIVAVGTPLHDDSVMERLIGRHTPQDQRQYADWVVGRFPALTALEESAWPEFRTTEQLQQEQLQDPHGFAQERLCVPTPEGFNYFPGEFFQEECWWRELPGDLWLSITVDPACRESEERDETAIITAGWSPDGTLYVVDCYHGRHEDPDDIVGYIMAQYLRWAVEAPQHHPGWHFHGVGIEKVAFQKFLIYEFQRTCRDRQLHPCVVELKGDRDKVRRIRQLVPLFTQHKIRLRADMTVIESQLRSFPNGAHDDVADALAYHLQFSHLRPSVTQAARVSEGWTFKEYVAAHESAQVLRRRYPGLDLITAGQLQRWN